MKIIEIFVSRQGEGLWTGTKSTFVRFGGCNLFCGFCDTRYASWECEEGTRYSLEKIAAKVAENGEPHVVLTGGEPMLPPEIVPLTFLLKEQNFKITIETNGTLDRPVCCDLMSISPKMSNSAPAESSEFLERHHQIRYCPEVVRRLTERYPFQLKFVVDTQADLEEIEIYLQNFDKIPLDRVLLMPKAVTAAEMQRKEEWLKQACLRNGYTYSPRMHLIWYGGIRGK